MTQPQRKSKTDWSAAFSKPETASRSLEPVTKVDVDDAEQDLAKPAPRRRGPYNVKKVDKKPATFRLPPDVHELIDRARQEAADNGIRLTKDDAVTAAVRHLYGRKRR
ncbi:MAG: hypothetical protein JST25_15355 [Actinobacteria bacterium]|nr:hypothetical protein [Actinomycetota bacterium]